MQVRYLSCKQQGSIRRKLWDLNKMILRRFTVEGLVLPVLILLRETAREGWLKKSSCRAMCSYTNGYDRTQARRTLGYHWLGAALKQCLVCCCLILLVFSCLQCRFKHHFLIKVIKGALYYTRTKGTLCAPYREFIDHLNRKNEGKMKIWKVNEKTNPLQNQ